jgi:peptide/nickel transport system substrate-binding protein
MHFFEQIFKSKGRELTLEQLTEEQEAATKKISVRGQEFGKFFNTDERYNSKPLGTGPYTVDKWERKDRVELLRNPNYWDPAKAGHVDKIIVKFIPDQVTALAAMKAGEIDFFYDMSAEQYFEDWPTLSQETRDTYVRADWFSPMFSYVGWNELASPLKDRRVRIALTMLFDRQEFVDKKLHGAAVVVSGTQYLFGPGYDREVAPIAYDPDTARELLTEAGWIDTDNDGIRDKDGVKFQMLLRMGKGKPINEQMCEVMQKNFKSAGIDLQIQTMEWASFVEKLRSKECDAVTLRWAMPVESDPFQIWHSSEAAREKRGSNTISFANAQADELIEMLRVTLDPEKRKRIHQSFHRLIDSEQPYTFLWIAKEFGAYHKRFRNVKWYRLRPGFDLSEWYVPKAEQLHK